MRASRAAELNDSNPWAHLALGWVAFLKRHTDAAVVEYQRVPDISPNFAAARWPSTGSRTEAYKVVWTGRCDWDCDSVLATGLLYGHRPARSYGVARLREGSRKNGIGCREGPFPR